MYLHIEFRQDRTICQIQFSKNLMLSLTVLEKCGQTSDKIYKGMSWRSSWMLALEFRLYVVFDIILTVDIMDPSEYQSPNTAWILRLLGCRIDKNGDNYRQRLFFLLLAMIHSVWFVWRPDGQTPGDNNSSRSAGRRVYGLYISPLKIYLSHFSIEILPSI